MLVMKSEIVRKLVELTNRCKAAEEEAIRLHNLYVETNDSNYWMASRFHQESKEEWLEEIRSYTSNRDNYFDDEEQ